MPIRLVGVAVASESHLEGVARVTDAFRGVAVHPEHEQFRWRECHLQKFPIEGAADKLDVHTCIIILLSTPQPLI